MIKKIFLIFILLLNANLYANSEYDLSNGYNIPRMYNDFNFIAILKDGYVYTNWNKYNLDEPFVYYKVIRSSTNYDPVYPDDGYITYSTDINFTSYIDKQPLKGEVYYRVCAITNLNNRYCSNVIKIINNKLICTQDFKICPDGKTFVSRTGPNCEFGYCPMIIGGDLDEYGCKASAGYSWCEVKNKCIRVWEEKCEIPTNNLSNALKIKSKTLVNKTIKTLETKGYSNDQIVKSIDLLISKLNFLKAEKSSLTDLVDYIITLLSEKKKNYLDDFNGIEDIFNSIQ